MLTIHTQQIPLGFSICEQNLLLQINKSLLEKSKSRFKASPGTNSYSNQRALQHLRKTTCNYAVKPREVLSHLISPGSPGFKRGLGHLFPGYPGFKKGSRLRSEYLDSRIFTEEDEEEMDEETRKKKEAQRIQNIKEDWIERGWAPWEEVLTPEADFALKSIEETQKSDLDGLQSAKSIEAFKRVTPKLRDKDSYDYKRNMVLPEQRTLKIGDEEYEVVPRTSQWGEPEPNETVWNGPLVFMLIPPRDWPPPGWKVDPKELAFIREAHKLESVRVDPQALVTPSDPSKASFPRFEMFMKQYKEWVAANKENLDKESLEVDYDYHPGRRRTGSNYVEGMYELPFIYPGQIYGGYVTSVHLYQGAFVFIGCVHDGWVPIKGNDWYWVRHHIKVGMHVQVEVVAKRDPYRFRFPIELRFVNPNINHLIFNRFTYPPIFVRNDTTNEELSRETGRPYMPRRRPAIKPEDEPLPGDHPYCTKIWNIHVSEQAVLDEEENDPIEKGEEDEYVHELQTDNKVYDSDNDGYWVEGQYEGIPSKLILITDRKDLEMDAARAERKIIHKLYEEAEAQGKAFVRPKLRREKQMDELNAMHKRRSIEQREALIRDISCRLELGLPVEEPGRYADDSLWSHIYSPWNKRFRSDYWGDPTKLYRKGDVRNVDYDEQYFKKKTDSKSPSTDVKNGHKSIMQKKTGMPKEEKPRNDKTGNFRKGNTITTTGNRPLVNGTESFSIGDSQGITDDQDNRNADEGSGEAATSDP